MATSIDQAFIKQFEREVHESYQRMGSKLRNTVRTISNVQGSSTVFQKVGKGVASTKSTHGMVPVMNLSHSTVETALQDYYAGDWVDRLDELKTNIDERQVIANAGAYALGRKTDELIINALATASINVVPDAGAGMSIAKILEAFEQLGEADVPDDGERYAVVGYKQWSELLATDEFTSADYVGTEDLPFRGIQAKRFLGTLFIPHSGLPIDGTGVRSCFWFHKTAIGHASGSDVQTDITWHGDRAAHFVNNMMSQGASLIDGNGVVVIECDETP
ncbi:phage capsid protein [Micavibrio aeruginosavorus]|uniref:phage capsid protein n=1 Tax=Micavibrio aeruginosavorus TaxID=349221 RepID=UPI003F4AE8C5